MNVEKLKVHPGSLMVFVDDTGHEEFADPNYPVFGFGGCAVPAFVARDVLERPWREMKERHFGGFGGSPPEWKISGSGVLKTALLISRAIWVNLDRQHQDAVCLLRTVRGGSSP